uniref:Putative serine hydrolase C5E4.05c n=1 Tax=Anthurium amnicola TaxID=1678845 RepID=A0A1D1YVV2_9ARAE
MKNSKTVEEWIITKDGCSVYTKSWKTAVQPPLATMVFLHGFGEHINRYNHMFPRFAQANIEVYAYDQRGFGKTGLKNQNLGITGGWKVIQEDITDALKVAKQPGVPLILFGHSMGGSLALRYAVEGPESKNISALIITSPLLSTIRVNDSAVTIGTGLSKVLPNLQFNTKIDIKYVSRDPNECLKYANDPYNHPYWSLKGASDVFRGAKSVLKSGYEKITHPIYLAHGTGDQVTSFDSSKKLYERLPSTDKTFRVWTGLFHEMHNELEKNQVIQEYIDWAVSRANQLRRYPFDVDDTNTTPLSD